jgi:hypothetical protein
MDKFTLPEHVTSPRANWTLIKVLHRGDPSEPEKHDPAGYSMAVGRWGESLDEQYPCLAIRWNCNEGRPAGHPHSRGLPTWFIVPEPLVAGMLGALPQEMANFARSILQ